MLKNEDLRRAQARFSNQVHRENIKVSIDRLTVIVDSIRPYKLFRDLRLSLSRGLQGNINFSVREVVNGAFSLEYGFDDDNRVNLIYFEIIQFHEELLRLDFNPNSLKEYGAMEIWRQIILFLKLNGSSVRLSRFDLAFDVLNLPSIIAIKHIKGGVKSTFYYGRSSELETVYWGSRASNVQVRLYDKNKERIQKKRTDSIDLVNYPYWWRLEMQLRTKAINADMMSEVVKRLENFGIYDCTQLVGNKAFGYIFLHDESMLPYVFSDLTLNSVRVKKNRLRKKLREMKNDFSDKLITVLREQSPKLAIELQQYTDEFLGFE